MLDKDQVIESAKNFTSKKNCVFYPIVYLNQTALTRNRKKKSRFYLRRRHLASLQRNNRIPT